MKSIRIVILFVIVSSTIICKTYSQKDSILFKQSVNINLNDLAIKRLFITYIRSVSTKNYLELNLGYKYCGPVSFENDGIDIEDGGIYDYSGIYYNNFTLRAGLRRYFFNRIFFGIMANYDYKFNNEIRISGSSAYNNIDDIYSKTKNQIGAMIKFGIVLFHTKILISDMYFGIGYLLSKNKFTFISGNNHYYDISSENNISAFPSFHFGISVGLKN